MLDLWFPRLFPVSLLAALVVIMIPSAVQAQCPDFPKFEFWGDISHKSVARYVENKMKGDWEAYIDRLEAIRHQLKKIYDQGKRAKIQLKNKRITLSSEKLHEYLRLTEKRIEIVRCLAHQAEGKKPGTKAIVASRPEGRGPDVDTQQTPTDIIKGNPSVGRVRSAICENCHGVNGVSDDPLFPNIAGQNVSYLIRQLRFMRDAAHNRLGLQYFDDAKISEAKKKVQSLLRNERSTEFMDDAVVGLGDQEIFDLAAYYAAQPCGQSTPVNDLSVPPLVSDRCVACHGERGIAKQPRFPNIAGQHRTYILDQLVEFKLAGLEAKTGTKNIMRNKSMALQVAELRHVEIEELATYFAALPCR